MEKDYVCSLSAYLSALKQVVAVFGERPQWIVAEVASVRNSWPTGHCYLDLIETDSATGELLAQAKGTIWRSRNSVLTPLFRQRTGGDLRVGCKIMIRLQANFSERYGLSLNIIDIDPSYTLGDLEAKKRETLARLEKEELLERNKELALPALPFRLAVVSSLEAAGYGDFMQHLKESGLLFKVELFKAPMQGAEAPAGIYEAFQKISQRAKEFDVVVFIRGGGSAVDLACFDDYLVAKAIALVPVPVISGIGHERDDHICDMVASIRVKTPTGAADYIINFVKEEQEQVEAFRQRIQVAVSNRLKEEAYMILSLASKINLAVKSRIEEAIYMLEASKTHLFTLFENKLGEGGLRLEGASEWLYRAFEQKCLKAENDLEMLQLRLQGANPANILDKGYAAVFVSGEKVTDIQQIREGGHLKLVMKDGSVDFVAHNVIINK